MTTAITAMYQNGRGTPSHSPAANFRRKLVGGTTMSAFCVIMAARPARTDVIARVAMNEWILKNTTMVAFAAPTTSPKPRPSAQASDHGKPCITMSQETKMPLTPRTGPTDRSYSPAARGTVSASAIMP